MKSLSNMIKILMESYFFSRKVTKPEKSQKREARTPNPEWNRELSPNTVTSSQGDLVVTSVRQNNELQVYF